MKVALIHIRYGLKGGLETRLQNYIRYFLKHGDEVTVICGKVLDETPIPKNVNFVHLDVSAYPRLLRPLAFDSKLKRFLSGKDYDFSLSLERTSAQDFVLAPNTHAGFLHRKKPLFKKPDDWVQLKMDRKAFSNSKIVFACSQMVSQEIVDYYGESDSKIQVLYPPLNTENFYELSAEEKESLRKKYGVREDQFVCSFVSTSHRRKGLSTIESLARYFGDRVLFLVAGTPFRSSLTNLRSLGFLQAPNDLYNIADLHLHPAFYEPFGQIVSESLSAGTPAIVSKWTGGKEIISEGQGLVIDTLETGDWAQKIEQILNGEISFKVDFKLKDELSLDAHMEKMLNAADINI